MKKFLEWGLQNRSELDTIPLPEAIVLRNTREEL